MLDFGERLKTLRKQKNLAQTQLAERLGVTKSIISAYESNLRLPSLVMLIKLANTFGVSTDYLLGVNKKQFLDISNLTDKQINLVKSIAEEFKSRQQAEK